MTKINRRYVRPARAQARAIARAATRITKLTAQGPVPMSDEAFEDDMVRWLDDVAFKHHGDIDNDDPFFPE